MTKKFAKYSSVMLGFLALALTVVDKFPLGEKEIPAALRKK